jgi:serralysin
MCVYCAQVGKAAGGFGCADVPAMTVDAKSDARAVDLQGGATFAPTIATDDPVSQNPGPGGDTVPGTTSTTFSVTNDAYVRGYINTSGDQDWYQVTLTAGQQYTFFLNGFGVGAIRDPYVRVFNAAGVLVAENDDSGPLNGSRLSYAPSASGTYYVSAGGYVPPIGAGSTGQYLLTMNDGGSPFSPTVSLTDVADYLSNSYWEVNGVAPAKWNITSITYKTTGLEPERAVLARIAFQAWADVTGLTFTEITSGTAKITLDDTTANAAFENSTTSGGVINSATINVSTDWYGGIDAIDSYTLQTFIHEIGHSLGLGHGGPYNGSANPGVDNVYANDSWHLSVMSYFDQFEMNVSSFRFIMTPEMADILAVQRYYGTPNTRPGDTIYGFGSNAGFTVVSGSGIQAVNLYNFAAYTQAPAFTIYDGAGIDTLDASGYSQTQLIDLRGGNFSHIGGLTGNIGIYTTTVIENATRSPAVTGSTPRSIRPPHSESW